MLIKEMFVRTYRDNGQKAAYVVWEDGSRTEGTEWSAHMQALIKRGRRDGLKLHREVW